MVEYLPRMYGQDRIKIHVFHSRKITDLGAYSSSSSNPTHFTIPSPFSCLFSRVTPTFKY